MSTEKSASDSDSRTVPDEYYEESDRKSFGSQQEVADAWAEGQYPTHNVMAQGSAGDTGAVLYTGSPTDNRFQSSEVDGTNTNFCGVQHFNGSGTLWHYSTREAIRLQDGTVISNQQCWAGGFAHCSVPEHDYEVPLDAIETHLNSADTVFDIETVYGQPQVKDYSHSEGTYEVTRARESIVVIDGADERYGIYVGRDGSIISGNSHFTFRLSADELGLISEVEDALRLLKPHEVLDSEMQVVDSDEFVKTKLDREELEAHKEAGGETARIGESRLEEDDELKCFHNSSYRDPYEGNRQRYRADLQGNVIVRHGEWFFIPEPDIEPDEEGTRYANEELDSHRPERHHGARSPMPEECDSCGASSFEIETEEPRFGSEYDTEITCKECGSDVPRDIYVHGEIRHTSNDHNAINLGDTWHKAISHDRDVRTYDESPGTGRRGGGGWD